jgi:hypothetical protein
MAWSMESLRHWDTFLIWNLACLFLCKVYMINNKYKCLCSPLHLSSWFIFVLSLVSQSSSVYDCAFSTRDTWNILNNHFFHTTLFKHHIFNTLPYMYLMFLNLQIQEKCCNFSLITIILILGSTGARDCVDNKPGHSWGVGICVQ